LATKKKDPRALTSRTKGAVGKNPLVYQAFRRFFTPNMVAGNLAVLDFGAGRDAVHTFKLRREGYKSVFAHDLPENMPTEYVAGWIATPRSSRWDIVLLSNVLNVQESRGDVVGLLEKIKRLMCRHGALILNFPESPRKSPVTPQELEGLVCSIFNPKFCSRVGGTVRAPCFYVLF
jgi:hypothetical protein